LLVPACSGPLSREQRDVAVFAIGLTKSFLSHFTFFSASKIYLAGAARDVILLVWADVPKSRLLPFLSCIAHTTPAQADPPAGFRSPQFSKDSRKKSLRENWLRQKVPIGNPILRSWKGRPQRRLLFGVFL
jgi:hypothetical protein